MDMGGVVWPPTGWQGQYTGFLKVEVTGAKRKCRGTDCPSMIPKGEKCLVSIEYEDNRFSRLGRSSIKKSFCHKCSDRVLKRHRRAKTMYEGNLDRLIGDLAI